MQPLVSLRNVVFSRWRGKQNIDVLDGINLDLFGGSTIGVMGPSGVGKSTLVSLIAGYLNPTAGTILEGGAPISGPSVSRVAVFQGGSLWPWLTLKKNVALGFGGKKPDALRLRELDEILERLGIAHAKDAYPGELSGGMRKRAELARAIVARPKVLMLDEALSSVDPVSKEICIQVVQEYRKRFDGSVLVVSHDVDEVIRTVDSVVMLSGTPARIEHAIDIDAADSMGSARGAILKAFGYT